MLLIKGKGRKSAVISDIANSKSVLLFVVGDENIYIPDSKVNGESVAKIKTFRFRESGTIIDVHVVKKPRNFSYNGTIEECIAVFDERFNGYDHIEDSTYDYIIIYTNQYDESDLKIKEFINKIKDVVGEQLIIILACK